MYFPQYERKVRPHGARRPVVKVRPVYPGYLFVRIDFEGPDIGKLVRLPVRARWVRFGLADESHLDIIPNFVVERLQILEKCGRLVVEVKHVSPYRVGTAVLVQSVQFGCIAATILRLIGDHKAEVNTTLGKAFVPIHMLEVA